MMVELLGGPAHGLLTAVRSPVFGQSIGFHMPGWPAGEYVLNHPQHRVSSRPSAVWTPGDGTPEDRTA